MSTTSEILNKAANLLEKPGAWTQGAYGRDAEGRIVPEYAEDCVCRCVVGAMWAATGRGREASVADVQPAVSVMVRTVGGSITDWNDAKTRTKAEVVAALRLAATTAQHEEGGA